MLLKLITMAALTCAVAAPSSALASSGVPQVPGDRDRIAQINETMGLTHSQILRLDIAPGKPAPETMVLLINDVPMIVQLHEHSVRHQDYTVYVQVEDGSLVEVEPAPANTYRGNVVGLEDAKVIASMEALGLYMRVIVPGLDDWWIEPLRQRFDDAAADEYVLYSSAHVLDCRGHCPLDQYPELKVHSPFLSGEPQDGSGGVASGLKMAEIACDADYQYFLKWGSVANVENRINSIINANNVLYENQTGLTHKITAIIVRTSSNQPYTSSDPNTLLNQFRNHWNANHGNIKRDLAHLFTGKNLNGNTIGIAWLGVVCNISWAYGLSQSDFSPNFSCVTDLTAHEIGHNWNAGHCSCPSHTMNGSITCANNFHSVSINQITQFAATRTCLDDVNPEPTGACCVSSATNACEVTTAANCAAINGQYQGDGVSCSQMADGCPICEIKDCRGTCSPKLWLGDGICDNGSRTYKGIPIYFNCADLVWDGCDCDGCEDPGDPPPGCPDGEIEDCNGNCAPASWVGNGICDDGSNMWNGVPIDFDCEEFNWDGGDCKSGDDPPDDPPGCPDGEIEDCNGNCAPASWVGNGLCDNGSNMWNGVPIDFNCDEFECDGGDCCDDDPDPPADPTSISVASISVTTFNSGQGRHKGEAVVTIVNDLGEPVQGATVTGTFSSPFNETHSGVTNSQGQVTLVTNGWKQGGNVNFNFCVTNVAGSLPYVPGNNAVTCAP